MTDISPWVRKHAGLLSQNLPILDLACGGGRHSLYLLELGHRVTAVDKDVTAIRANDGVQNLSIVEADLEAGTWPFSNQLFAGIVVVNYLWRPIFNDLLTALAPGGVLIYDTFAVGNEKYGRPSNPDYLLRSNELKRICAGLEIIDYAHGKTEAPSAVRQSIAARNNR